MPGSVRQDVISLRGAGIGTDDTADFVYGYWRPHFIDKRGSDGMVIKLALTRQHDLGHTPHAIDDRR
jgi:hypothetical protein